MGDSPEDKILADMIMNNIEDALDELPAEQREVFILHEFENHSMKDIVKITGMAVGGLTIFASIVALMSWILSLLWNWLMP